ncbi:MAG: multicomponent Na+:H+ antiporter subunit C [Hyphomicrobiaceae bacterium]|jgi:multicomponent Na+:H+ antiporter subunit C
MDSLILIVVAAFVTGGVYLVLDRTLLRVALGLGLLSNGTNLFLLSSGGLAGSAAPILEEERGGGALGHTTLNQAAAIADPLPQALILTAIVISFGVTALLLVIAYRTHQSYDSDDLAELHGRLHDE